MEDKATIFQEQVLAFPPHEVSGRPGVFRVIFAPRRAWGEQSARRAVSTILARQAVLLVDSATSEVIEHTPFDHSVAGLDSVDFEQEAVRLVKIAVAKG
jgi:hypothetical protein